MTEHKHAALIKAWAEGAKIQKFSKRTQTWEESANPTWNEEQNIVCALNQIT